MEDSEVVVRRTHSAWRARLGGVSATPRRPRVRPPCGGRVAPGVGVGPIVGGACRCGGYGLREDLRFVDLRYLICLSS